MDKNVAVFIFGLILLCLFCWYFFTDSERAKRNLGTILTVLLTAFCIWFAYPPFDSKDAKGNLIGEPGKIHLGLDLQGGTSFLIRLNPPADDKGVKKEITKDMVDQAMEAIRKRVDQFGVSEPIITPQGTDRILVQIPGLDETKIADAREQLRKVAKLEFHLVHPQSRMLAPEVAAGQEAAPPGYSLQEMETERGKKPVTEQLLIKNKADLLGSHVTHAYAFYDQQGWGVSLEFDNVGAEQFRALTEQVAHEHSQMAIVLDAKVISAPTVDEKYTTGIAGGRAQISGGNMNEQEARSLASALQNPLQTPVVIEEQRSASSTLGQDAIRSGILAGIGGLVLVLVFVVIYYRFAGLVAVVGLVVNIIVLFGTMAMFGFVLTLPGIAGVILTIGLAVDANVLIYERWPRRSAPPTTRPSA
jgi:SecD/SecF fusion protein